MTPFGKDVQRLEVVGADFLPDGNQLLFVVADAESNIHILQYDPERKSCISLHRLSCFWFLLTSNNLADPKSLAGQRLIRRAEFYTGHEIRSVTMLPRTSLPSTTPSPPTNGNTTTNGATVTKPEYICLISTLTGILACITTAPEPVYRRLNIIQNQLISGEEHPAGLNPKGYRAASLGAGRTQSSEILRGLLDGGFLQRRWAGLGEGRKVELAAKAGVEVARVREDMAGVETALMYL